MFVSADAALHAWHYSFQRLLEESEETQLTQALRDILDGLKTRLVEQPDAVRNGPLRDSLADADYFMAVARSLLSGQQQATVLGGDQHVSETLAAIAKLEYVPDPPASSYGEPTALWTSRSSRFADITNARSDWAATSRPSCGRRALICESLGETRPAISERTRNRGCSGEPPPDFRAERPLAPVGRLDPIVRGPHRRDDLRATAAFAQRCRDYIARSRHERRASWPSSSRTSFRATSVCNSSPAMFTYRHSARSKSSCPVRSPSPVSVSCRTDGLWRR